MHDGVEVAALAQIERAKALFRNDHFVGNSGAHLPDYFHKDWLYRSTRATEALASDLARKIAIKGKRIPEVDVIVAPEKGAIILSHLVAKYLDRRFRQECEPEILSVYAEKEKDADGKDTGRFVFSDKRLYRDTVAGKKVWLIEDVTTTGGSIERVIELCRGLGAEVLGVGVLWNRGGTTAEKLGVPEVISLIETRLPAYDPKMEPCPMCNAGTPINEKLGHGKKYMETRRAGATEALRKAHDASM